MPRRKKVVEEPELPPAETVEEPEAAPPPKPKPVEPRYSKDGEAMIALVPELRGVVPSSLEAALAVAMKFGLPPRDGFASIRRLDNRAVFLLGYRGGLWLSKKSNVKQIECRAVFERDTWALDYGQRIVRHAPYEGMDSSGSIIGAYCTAIYMDGSYGMEFVTPRDVVKDFSAYAGMVPAPDGEELFKKAALFRLSETSPFDMAELTKAIRAERNGVAGAPIALV